MQSAKPKLYSRSADDLLIISRSVPSNPGESTMAYQQVKTILESIRKFHRQLRQEVEEAYSDTDDPRAKFLMRAFRRSEKEMDAALGQYEKDGNATVLETWIQYVSCEEVEKALHSGELPPHSKPEEVVEWKREFDAALAGYYHQLARQVSAPRAKELFESLATTTEQMVSDQSWQAREEELAPPEDSESR